MTGRAARWTVAGCVAATFAMAVAAFLLARGLHGARGVGTVAVRPRDVMIPAVYVLTGAGLVWLRPRNAVGWVLVGVGVCPVASTFLGVYGVDQYVSGGPTSAGQAALALASWL